MNDDWDGVDWAKYFSGPDDCEIEIMQEDEYQESMIDCYDIDDPFDGVFCEATPDEAVSEPSVEATTITHQFDFNSIKEVDAFTAYIRNLGAKNILIIKNGPLPIMDIQNQDYLVDSKEFMVTFKTRPIPYYLPHWSSFHVFLSLDCLYKFGYIDIQIKDGNVFNHMLRLDKSINICEYQEISSQISILVKAANVVESNLAISGESDGCRDSHCSEYHDYGCMFHFHFIRRIVHYAFYDKGFTCRVADQRVWNLDDGELFKEIFENHPFDADDLDQIHFFYDMGAWPRSKIMTWQFDYSNDLTVPLHAEKSSYADGAGNPRIDAMIDSIDRTIGQRHLQNGETKAMCFVSIDCKKRTIEFERRFYTPFNRIFRAGILTFDLFAFTSSEFIES